MPLDPSANRFLRMLAVGGFPVASELDPQTMRAAFVRLAQGSTSRTSRSSASRTGRFPGPAGPLPIRIYTPITPDRGLLPGLLYFHGGAWVFCDLDTHDGLCRMLANESGCRVVSVGYRLAPEHRLPAAIEDSMRPPPGSQSTRSRWRSTRAGSPSAATRPAARWQRRSASWQSSAADRSLPSRCCSARRPTSAAKRTCGANSPRAFFFERTTLQWALKHACPPELDLRDPRVSPLLATDFSGLPPAEIHTAEFDPLRDEGAAYAPG